MAVPACCSHRLHVASSAERFCLARLRLSMPQARPSCNWPMMLSVARGSCR
jgi:hypothetical protein